MNPQLMVPASQLVKGSLCILRAGTIEAATAVQLLDFYMGSENPNSEPQACTAST